MPETIGDQVYSTGDLCKRFGTNRERLTYALRRAGMEPRARVGISGVWFETDLPKIRAALEAIRSRPTVAALTGDRVIETAAVDVRAGVECR